ncbi:serine-rich aggregation substance UasX [Leuconostoc mesenteroides]|uniref:serine-rich aggregation substance UasX n=1 Tax=Leuconostoc mesenteroides TaxID=1245 RepID=UPI0027309423|nr:serine-rich aggregation substance UasX [Leuconostoc mesenteroides]MDP0487840.1 serine-rich aggregation substance UasX [Leuconostoc mesenteroides]
MENSKTYKLYKSGKLWVIAAVAVAGVAVSANTTQVNADTVSNTDAQAVKTTDTAQDDKQAQLTASSTDQTKTDDTAKADNVSLTAEKSTVPTTDTSTAQSIQATSTVLPQVKADALTSSVDPVASATSSSDDFGDNDDSNLPGGDTGSSSSSDNGGTSSSDDNSGTDTPTPTPGDDDDNGSTLPDDNGGTSSSSDNGGSSSGNVGSSSSSDNGGSNSSSDQGGSSNNGGTDNSNAGGSSSSNDTNTVPLTPTAPDKNDQGEINHVKPVEVTPDSSGNVVSVPTQVASVPSVARAVESYNQALTANDKDANNDKVVEAKQKLDDAVAKALPETHATQAKSSIGILSAVSGVLAMTGALIFKLFKN